MSPRPTAHLPGVTTGPRRALIALVVAVSLTSVGCGSSDPTPVEAESQPKTEVLGQLEQQGPADEVRLLDPVCITNTPTHAPC